MREIRFRAFPCFIALCLGAFSSLVSAAPSEVVVSTDVSLKMDRRLSDFTKISASSLSDNTSRFLLEVQHAADNTDYAGIYVWQSGEKFVSSKVVHVVDGEGIKERVLILDGMKADFRRLNDDSVFILHDENKTVRIMPRSNQFPHILITVPEQASQHYDLKKLGTDRVAGVACDDYELSPKYNDRNAFRFCLDPEHHLMLKFQRLRIDGAVLEQVMFTNVKIAKNVDRDDLKFVYQNFDWSSVWGEVKRDTPPLHLQRDSRPDSHVPPPPLLSDGKEAPIGGAAAVSIPSEPPPGPPPSEKELPLPISSAMLGFPPPPLPNVGGKSPVKQATWFFKVPAGFELLAKMPKPDGGEHLVFTDGLTSFSIFVKPARSDEREMPKRDDRCLGPFNLSRKKADPYWVTAVSGMPTEVLDRVINSARFVPNP